MDTYSEEWRLLCLARYVANHPCPAAFSAKLERRHGAAFVEKLRGLLREHGR